MSNQFHVVQEQAGVQFVTRNGKAYEVLVNGEVVVFGLSNDSRGWDAYEEQVRFALMRAQEAK